MVDLNADPVQRFLHWFSNFPVGWDSVLLKVFHIGLSRVAVSCDEHQSLVLLFWHKNFDLLEELLTDSIGFKDHFDVYLTIGRHFTTGGNIEKGTRTVDVLNTPSHL